MIFSLFAAAITAAFFVGSLILLNYGRQLGLVTGNSKVPRAWPVCPRSRARYLH